MGKTYAKKVEAREQRLKTLPRAERLAKTAQIKKKEGRVLAADEKHALKMQSEYGDIMRLWEVLRSSMDPTLDPKVAAERQQKRLDRKEQRKRKVANARAKKGDSKTTRFEDEDEDEDDNASSSSESAAGEDEVPSTTATATASDAPKQPKEKKAPRTVERFEYKYATIDKLISLITPKFASVVKTPRVSRVLQSMIKFGSHTHLEKLTSLLSSDLLNHCNDAFAHFVVCALIRHAPHALYKKLVSQLLPIVPQLVTHKFGIQVLHAAYAHRLCSTVDRDLLILGVCKDSVSVMKHWRGFPVLERILEEEADHRKRLMQRIFDLTDKLVSQKDAVTIPFVQRLVLAFLRHGTKHEVLEMCVTLKPHLAKLCETKEGAELACLAFSLLEPRAKKDGLRVLSDNLIELALGKYSAPVVARLFDLVYDAQLLVKFVMTPLQEHFVELINSPYAYLIVMHLLVPEEARRERLLLPGWKDYNLYSEGNAHWNHHTWWNTEMQKETVEICSKPAQRTHLSVLPALVKKLISMFDDEETKAKMNKTHVGLIAREIVHLTNEHPAYKAALELTESDLTALRALMPNKEQKKLREEEGPQATGKAAEAAKPEASTPGSAAKRRPREEEKAVSTPQSAKKRARTEGATATPASAKAPQPAPVDDDAPVERSARAARPPATPESARKAVVASKRSPMPKMK